MDLPKQQERYVTVEYSTKKGRYLIARRKIPAYTPIAWFGSKQDNRVKIKRFEKDKKKDDKTRYIVRDLQRPGYIFSPTDAEIDILHNNKAKIDVATFPAAFLINEPYMKRIRLKKKSNTGPFYKYYGQNVTIVRDDLHKLIYLMTTHMVEPGEELLWFYGYRYPCPRDYIVYAPEVYLEFRRLRNDRLIIYEPKPQLPEWVVKGDKSDACVIASFTKRRGGEEKLDDYFTFTFGQKNTPECDDLPAMTDDTGLQFQYRVTRMATDTERVSNPNSKRMRQVEQLSSDGDEFVDIMN